MSSPIRRIPGIKKLDVNGMKTHPLLNFATRKVEV